MINSLYMVKNIIIHYEVPYKSGISSAAKKRLAETIYCICMEVLYKRL